MSVFKRYISYLERQSDGVPVLRVRYRALQHTSLLGLAVNSSLVLAKTLVGWAAHSVSVMGDAVNNLSDCVSSLVSLLASRFAKRPADDNHPFGHARLEYLASTFIAALVFFIGLELGKQSIGRIIKSQPVAVSPVLAIVLSCSIFLKLLLFLVNRHLGRYFDSDMMRAVASDSIADVLSTTSVLVGLLVGRLTGLRTDGWFGLAVSVFILYSGFDILKETISRLLGAKPDPDLSKKILDLVNDRPGILGSHDLILHDYGPGRYFATVDVEVDAAAPILISHERIDEIERDVKRETGVQLVVHLDPVVLNDPLTLEFKEETAAIVRQIPGFIDFHDFRISRKQDEYHVIFDIVIEPGAEISDQDIYRRIESALNEAHPPRTIRVFLTVDRSYHFNYVADQPEQIP